MWQIKAQFNTPNKESPSNTLEWNAVHVDTLEEAEAWWRSRTNFNSNNGTVHTMWNPQGEIVRVSFK